MTPDIMYCPSCGTEITVDSAFCNHCGTSVDFDAIETDPEANRHQSTASEREPQATPGSQGSTAGSDQGQLNTRPTGTGADTSEGLDDNVAGALSYLFGFFTGLIFYITKEDNEFVRFHSAQSMIVFGGLVPLSYGLGVTQVFLSFVPVIGRLLAAGVGILSALIGPIAIGLWIVLVYKAYQGERYGLPFIGAWIERSI